MRRVQGEGRVCIEPAADASAPQERRTPVDPNVFRRQVRTILRSLDRMRSSEAYWHVGAVVNEVQQVLEQAQGFVAAGDGHNALAILEAITEAYVADWVELDDSDGEASAFFEGLGAVWTEAVLTADLTTRERQTWAEKLTRWQREVDNYGVDEALREREALQAALQIAEHGLTLEGAKVSLGYYSDPTTVRLLGTAGRPPQPHGHHLEPLDLSLLENIKQRQPIYRQA